MFTVYFFGGSDEIYIERRVTTFIDILGTIGGFASVIILVVRLIQQRFGESMLHSHLIKKLYWKSGPIEMN